MDVPARIPDGARRLDRRGFGRLVGAVAATSLVAGCGPDRPAGFDSAPIPAAPPPAGARRIAYGDHPDQYGDLTLPEDRPEPRALVVVVHGGSWRVGVGPENMRSVVPALVAAGYATWNIGYRRVGSGGGWPGTLSDVAAATDHVTELDAVPFDPDRTFALGHSAGGHLAMWLAARGRLPAGAPGADPRVTPAGVVSQAGVLDLVSAAGHRGSNVPPLLGGTPEEVPDRYAVASPIAHVPSGVPSVCVHGTADQVVPIAQSEEFLAAATAAGDRSELVRVDGATHISVIDASTPGWRESLAGLERLTG
ncbi:alpha/beta fold hydrolase [Pseudonocardia nematodicida]|uniref:Alpha/beta fold hydrolase n=1 Tax=Pseudonocardia nematodicida TaxID=1206997 RepID=A0ABV1KKJ6_9PSEU